MAATVAAPDVEEFVFGNLKVSVHANTSSMALAAAQKAGAVIRDAVAENGTANLMFATGNSQIEFITELVCLPDIPWSSVNLFHLDEYVGVGPDHPAGFQRWIRERIANCVNPNSAHFIDGLADPDEESRRYARLIKQHPLDLCCVGIGENGHLAFNDPPVADFQDSVLVKVVKLDEASRLQQVGEGHFPTLETVPKRAITVTIPTMIQARQLIAVAPESRKAVAVNSALTGPITTACPASILRNVDRATLYLDSDSATLLD
jgi:glucosamine-6-phosphate deaminase